MFLYFSEFLLWQLINEIWIGFSDIAKFWKPIKQICKVTLGTYRLIISTFLKHVLVLSRSSKYPRNSVLMVPHGIFTKIFLVAPLAAKTCLKTPFLGISISEQLLIFRNRSVNQPPVNPLTSIPVNYVCACVCNCVCA